MNTAGRLLSLYDRLVKHMPGNAEPMIRIWASVFEIPRESPDLEDEIVSYLQAVRSELDLLSRKLKEMGVDESLINPGFTRIRNVTSPSSLNAAWKSHADEISKLENRIPLLWANWVLRDDDEGEMPDEKLTALLLELEALEKSLLEIELTPYLRKFLLQQILSIRSALRLSRLQGAAPIETAMERVAGAIAINRQTISGECSKASEPAKSLLQRFGSALNKAAEIAGDLKKIKEGGQGMIEVGKAVIDLLPLS